MRGRVWLAFGLVIALCFISAINVKLGESKAPTGSVPTTSCGGR